eukprot:gnl/Chilomastix_caulleri/7125.p1 GENE.gnl/Chilomastix_caulleri/7125~~gnl/Chilomastix_caulleri/7125.p1  ORF type:complete len:116 (+),score=36.30 gnl/Chilomastix_caulleri/7125:51-398(+)
MVFVRVIKGRAYFKRFQVQFRRRREGKTDYNLRKQLVSQDKTKFNIPKYRFVVRISRKNVICQIISAKLDHDEVLCCAQSNELPRYGITPEKVEAMYLNAHIKIRENPNVKKPRN